MGPFPYVRGCKRKGKKMALRKRKTVKKKRTRKTSTAKKTAAQASRENGKLGGRPQRDLDAKETLFFETMCKSGAREVDIAEALRVDVKTLNAICKRRYGAGFSQVREQKKGVGRASLSAKQLDLALKGNVAMCIWLGKQWLDQKEPTQKREISGPEGAPIPVGIDASLHHALTKLDDEELDELEAKIENVLDAAVSGG